MRVLVCLLLFSSLIHAFAHSVAPQPKPGIAMAEALRIADKEFERAGRLGTTRLGWMWLLGTEDPEKRQWLVARFEVVDGKFRHGSVISIGMDGKAASPADPANPFGIGAIREPMAPGLGLEDALKRATEFAKTRIKLEDWYIHRIGLCRMKGGDDVRWLVTWDADLEKSDGGKDRFQVVVDMVGNVSMQDQSPEWLALEPAVRTERPRIVPDSGSGSDRSR